MLQYFLLLDTNTTSFYQSTLQISVMTITLYVNTYNGTSNMTLFHRMTMNLIKIQHEYKC
jgi:hypothetical protein